MQRNLIVFLPSKKSRTGNFYVCPCTVFEFVYRHDEVGGSYECNSYIYIAAIYVLGLYKFTRVIN
jgi:hypothetical protein